MEENTEKHNLNIKNTVVTQRVLETEEKVEKTPNTIKNLSRPLIKKIQKKIKKRRKRKKIYKRLIQKITESIAKVNPNINLTSSLNNNSIILSSKIGDVFSLNPELNYMVFISTSSDFNFDEYYKASQEFKFAIFGDCIGQKKCLNYLKNITNIDIDNTDIILIKTNLCKNDFKCNNNEINILV